MTKDRKKNSKCLDKNDNHNPCHNILELHNVSVQVYYASSKTELDI